MMYNVIDYIYDIDEWFDTLKEAREYCKKLLSEWCDYGLIIKAEDGTEWSYS